ncbi:MAG: 50S ribosomal protein L29 [archaeon]|nr:MAG: 50S ribosomal protein L29 [archaeon]
MAILRTKEIRKMTETEMEKKMKEMRLELSKKRAQIIVGGAPENAGRIREIKKTIARIKTVMNEKDEK